MATTIKNLANVFSLSIQDYLHWTKDVFETLLRKSFLIVLKILGYNLER